MRYEDHPTRMGRPTRADGASKSVTIRLSDDERDAVWMHVQKSGWTRAALVREAMFRMGLFNARGRVRVEEDGDA